MLPAEFLLMSDSCGGFEVDGVKSAEARGVSSAPPDAENKHLSLGKLLVSSSTNQKKTILYLYLHGSDMYVTLQVQWYKYIIGMVS